jgi:hypothetical protein
MSTYARLVHSLSDTDSLIPAQAEARGRTATGLIRTGTQWTNLRPRSTETRINKPKTGRTGTG